MSTRKFLPVLFFQLVSLAAFAKSINPETWSKGKLYELSTADDDYVHCMYLEPSGTFIFLIDNGDGGVSYFTGIWKRNSLNGRINFSRYADVRFWPLDESYLVLNDGLYASAWSIPDFIPAKKIISDFFLPQIEAFRSESDNFYGFYGMSEIGKVVDARPWHLDFQSFDGQKTREVLKRSEHNAQQESNLHYEKEKIDRKNWKHLYPAAWSFAAKEFEPLTSDTAKLRAMCNWLSANIVYKLKESREQNPSHDPDFIFTQHFGICLDYSLLLNVFCESVGIPCFDVAGYPLNTKRGKQPSLGNSYHAWNFVKVNGIWKAVDPTWYKSNEPEDHFLEDLSSYQYEHVPTKPGIRANPYAPSDSHEVDVCPVVKQSSTDILYIGNFDYITVANSDELEVVLYSTKETELELIVDSAEHHHHSVTFVFSICFGCVERPKDLKEKVTYHLTKGVNRLKVPLKSVLAKYTLKNDDFEISFIASPERHRAAAFEKMTSFDEKSTSLIAAYRYFNQWLNGDPSTMTEIDESLRNHPNWEYLRRSYRNEELSWSSGFSAGEVIFEFGNYNIAGSKPYISILTDNDGKIIEGPMLLLDY